DLRLRHREAHVGEQAAGAPFADVAFGLLVRFSGCRADHVEADLECELLELYGVHMEDCARVKAIRIHEDGGPDVLRYEDAPDPPPAEAEVLVRLRAAALNHINPWIRGGQPSAPNPRILGEEGAEVRVNGGGRVCGSPGAGA